MEMSKQREQGMGAIPFDVGVAFRVWAPSAEAMAVAGEFNDWSTTANPLIREDGSEFWYGEVMDAKVGQQYKFAVGKNRVLKLDPYAREVTSTSGNAIIQPWPPELVDEQLSPPDFDTPKWNEMVICELHIGSFNRKGEVGTFKSAAEKLPDLAKIGVNTIELMPVAAFPEVNSQGYDPALPFAVQGSYGGSKGLAEFILEAHRNGLAVILDVVYNHFGPNDLDGCLWRFDGTSQDDYGGIYFYQDWRAATPWGERNRPDYGRPEVRQYIRDNALHWVEQFQVDGLRFDSVSHIRNVYGNNDDPEHDLPDGWSLLQWINEEIAQRNPWKITIAEDLLHNEWVTRETGAGGAGFGSQWDIGFSSTVRAALSAVEDKDRDLPAVANTIGAVFDGNAFCRVIYTESHDDADKAHGRVPSAIDPDNPVSFHAKKRTLLGAAAMLTSPGVPLLLQGQIMFELEPFDDSQSLDWNNQRKFKGIALAYSDLISLRRNLEGHSRGLTGQGITILDSGPELIAFHRFDRQGPGDDVIVVLNFTAHVFDSVRVGFPRQGFWKVRFNSDWNGYCEEFGNAFAYDTVANPEPFKGSPCSGNVGVGAYTAIILSQDPE
jgi:1,4-alpha-glucan branching enzyme